MIGKTLAHYEITDLIGKGGMGEVYRARDTRLKRDVALKVLPTEITENPERLARFQREAEMIASLSHPHIVTLFSVEEANDARFLTMELVEGRGLDTMITPGGLPLPKILEIGIAVADALATAHEKGVAHRDLKPGNVMVARDGRVKLLDFGLAKLCEPMGVDNEDATVHDDLTRSGVAVGTLPYMSPEQLTGGPVDVRTDLFSLGVLLYELSAGARPFTGESGPDVSASILGSDPVPLDRVRADLPSDLVRIVRRCLAKNPDRRVQTARDVRNELEDLRLKPASRRADTGAATDDPGDLVERRHTITTAHVRRLQSRLTAMIGDSMELIDNQRESDILVFCLHGLGADHTDFQDLVRISPFRIIAASQFGFGPSASLRLELPLQDHNRLIALLAEQLIAEIAPEHFVVIGHSSGCDQWAQIICSDEHGALCPDGFIALGPSFRSGPGLVSGPYSQLTDDPEDIMTAIKTVSTQARDLDEWIAAHEYLIRAFRKFRFDIAPLRRCAIDLIESRADNALFNNFRATCERVPVVRCVFAHDDSDERDYALNRHLQEDALGSAFDELMFVDAPVGHVELVRSPVVGGVLESVVQAIRNRSR